MTNTTNNGESMDKIIIINGVEYAPVNPPPQGTRAVVVVDRGWIFAGDVTEENGRIYLDRAVWVFKWRGIGFSRVIEDPTQEGVDVRPMSQRVDIPAGSEIYRVPVADGWGL